ncbi:MAG: hypothetical protein U9N42_06225 [Campylobacterota bacterium]|nr:hypothetical protein [Campylobacterota bacterium]
MRNNLVALLEEEVIPELEGFIDDLYELIAKTKTASNDDKEALNEALELKKDFVEMLVDVKNGEIEDDELQEIIDDINEMREE